MPDSDNSPTDKVDEVAVVLDELPPLKRKGRKQRLVLIGAGRVHLQILQRYRDRPIRGVDLILVSPFPESVSGDLLPLALAGVLREHEIAIDLARLAMHCGAEFLMDKVVGLDLETRTLQLAHHDELSFDVASINIGAANVREELCQTHRLLVAVKPFASFLTRLDRRWQELTAQWEQAAGSEPVQLAVVGGGAAGVELAFALEQRTRRAGWPAEIHLIEALSEILPGYSSRTVRLVKQSLAKVNIAVHVGSAVVSCDDEGPSVLVFENGERLRADLAIWAAGAAPPGILRNFPLPCMSSGFLAVRQTLQTTAQLPVFAVGGVAEVVGRPSPRSSDISEAQAPVLWQNLRRWFRGGEPVKFEPPQPRLRFLSAGDETAIVEFHGWALRSSWLGRWKLTRDRHDLRRLRDGESTAAQR